MVLTTGTTLVILVVGLLASPLVPYLNKAHGEAYSVCLLTWAMVYLLNNRILAAAVILSAIGAQVAAFAPLEAVPGSTTTNPQAELIEPLSQRELEVLKLICQGLSNNEICKQLYLALDTVKGHNRRIFEKLQIHRRTEAIARARELNLF